MQTGSVISNIFLPLCSSASVILICHSFDSLSYSFSDPGSPSLLSSLLMLRELWLPQWRSLSLHSIPPTLPCCLLVSLLGQIHAPCQPFWFLLTAVFHWITCFWPSYLVYIYLSSPAWSSLLHCSSCLLLPWVLLKSTFLRVFFSIPFFFQFNLLLCHCALLKKVT